MNKEKAFFIHGPKGKAQEMSALCLSSRQHNSINNNIQQEATFTARSYTQSLKNKQDVNKQCLDKMIGSSDKQQNSKTDSQIQVERMTFKEGDQSNQTFNAQNIQKQKVNFHLQSPKIDLIEKTPFHELMLEKSKQIENSNLIKKMMRMSDFGQRSLHLGNSVTLTECICPKDSIPKYDIKEWEKVDFLSRKNCKEKVMVKSNIGKQGEKIDLNHQSKQLSTPSTFMTRSANSQIMQSIPDFKQLEEDFFNNLKVEDDKASLNWKVKRSPPQRSLIFLDQKSNSDYVSSARNSTHFKQDEPRLSKSNFMQPLTAKQGDYHDQSKRIGSITSPLADNRKTSLKFAEPFHLLQYVETTKKQKNKVTSQSLTHFPLMNSTSENITHKSIFHHEDDHENFNKIRAKASLQNKLNDINKISSNQNHVPLLSTHQMKQRFTCENGLISPKGFQQNDFLTTRQSQLKLQRPISECSPSYTAFTEEQTNHKDLMELEIIKKESLKRQEELHSASHSHISFRKKLLPSSQMSRSEVFHPQKYRKGSNLSYSPLSLLQADSSKEINFDSLIQENNYERNIEPTPKNHILVRQKKSNNKALSNHSPQTQSPFSTSCSIKFKEELTDICKLLDHHLDEIADTLLKNFSKNLTLVGLMREYCLISKEEFICEMTRFLRLVLEDFKKDHIEFGNTNDFTENMSAFHKEHMKFPMVPKLLIDWIDSHIQISVKNLINHLRKTNPQQRNYCELEQGLKQFLIRYMSLADIQLLPHGIFEEIGGIRGLTTLLEELSDLISEEIQQDPQIMRNEISSVIQVASGVAKGNFKQLIDFIKQYEMRWTSAEFFVTKKVLINMLYEGRAIKLNSSISLLSENAVKSIVESIEVSRSIINNRSQTLLSGESLFYEINHSLLSSKVFCQKAKISRICDQFIKELCEALYLNRTARIQFSQKFEKIAQEPLDKLFYDAVTYSFLTVLQRPEFRVIISPALIVDTRLHFYLLEVDLKLIPKPVFNLVLNIESFIGDLFTWVEDEHFHNVQKFKSDLIVQFDRNFMSFFLRSALFYGGYSAEDTLYSLKCYKVNPDVLGFWVEGMNHIIQKQHLNQQEQDHLKQFLSDLIPPSLFD